VKRLVAQELTLSVVPDAEQRLWCTVMRHKYEITRSRVQLHDRLESLLEEAQIRVSSVVSDLLQALADGETDPTALASPADSRLRATPDRAWGPSALCGGSVGGSHNRPSVHFRC
jgi:hypothetical protein